MITQNVCEIHLCDIPFAADSENAFTEFNRSGHQGVKTREFVTVHMHQEQVDGSHANIWLK